MIEGDKRNRRNYACTPERLPQEKPDQFLCTAGVGVAVPVGTSGIVLIYIAGIGEI